MNSTTDKPAIRVLVIDDDDARGLAVANSLRVEGFHVCGRTPFHIGVLKLISDEAPDVILIEMDSPGRDLLESLSLVATHNPTPIVMATQSHDPGYMSAAVKAGVSTYLVGSIDSDRVSPIIDVAMAQFEAYQALRSELADTRSELESRRAISQATALLMATENMDEKTAYGCLRSRAMSLGLRIDEVAERLLAAAAAKSSAGDRQ